MNIKEYRLSKGLTQPGLAKELNQALGISIDAPLISKLENGVVYPSPEIQAYIDTHRNYSKVDLTPTQERIYSLLKNSEGTVSRSTLCFFCQQDDRSCRKDISEMRKKGIRICSSSTSRGYWLAKSESDYKDLRAEYLSRISDMASVVKAMDSFVEGQVGING